MDNQKIGEFIAKNRRENKMTQEQLAEKIGVTSKTISRWENGNYMPNISLMKKLCEIFDISIDELIYSRRIKDNEIKKLSEKSAINLYITKKKILTLQILTEILIFVGIILTITLTSVILKK